MKLTQCLVHLTAIAATATISVALITHGYDGTLAIAAFTIVGGIAGVSLKSALNYFTRKH